MASAVRHWLPVVVWLTTYMCLTRRLASPLWMSSKQALATFLSEGLTTFEAVTAAEEARRGRWTTKQASVLNTMKLFFRR